jgi:hypothetical protein
MKRFAVAAALLCACSSSSSARRDVHEAEDLQATQHLAIDTHQEAQIEARELITTGPGEQVREAFGPDGGIVERTVTRWGGSSSEKWLQAATQGDDHLELDAGVVVIARLDEHEEQAKESHPAASCAFAGGAWLVLVVLVGAFLLRRLWPLFTGQRPGSS